MFSKALVVTSLLAGALALPEVTIKELPAGCSSFPGYDAASKSAGPWSLTTAGSDNPLLVNVGLASTYSLGVDSRGHPYFLRGYVSVNRAVDVARARWICADDALQIFAATSVSEAGAPGDNKYVAVKLSPYPYDAGLLYMIDSKLTPSLYEHYAGEEKQDGYFLGGYNTTTWGITWQEASPTSYFYPWFYMRLLPEGQALKANETKTFIKIQV